MTIPDTGLPARWLYWPKGTAEYLRMAPAERAAWHSTLGQRASLLSLAVSAVAVLVSLVAVIL